MRYAELHCKTNFSFLEGASHADELVARAEELGYAALAVTDRESLAGVVRAHIAAKEAGLKLIIGAEVHPIDAASVVLWATDRKSYGWLSRLLTVGRRRAEKGKCRLMLEDIAGHAEGLIAGVVSQQPGVRSQEPEINVQGSEFRAETDGKPNLRVFHPDDSRLLAPYADIFPGRAYLLAELFYGPDDAAELNRLIVLSKQTGLPLVAAGDVHYHSPARQPLFEVLTATRLGTTVYRLAEHRFANAQRHLRTLDEITALYALAPDALQRTLEIADRCKFSLDELKYEYPIELTPPGLTPSEYLASLAWEGAHKRYPQGIPDKVRQLVERELVLIQELHYEAYFLTVWDLVQFARSRGILCQGRGSAANSAVCYCLEVTSIDPAQIDVLFERFVSKERNEAPDIDVDFEHERREEVLQYIYNKYGRDRAGMTAVVITYRTRSAVRDVGKALGLSLDRVDALAKNMEGRELDGYFNPDLKGDKHENPTPPDEEQQSAKSYKRELSPVQILALRCAEVGIDPTGQLGQRLLHLVTELVGFPRHLSQHVGGMVITQGPLCELSPIENAAMPDRTVIEWDKDDLDELGILKVDCLCLGMLTAIRKCFDFLNQPGANLLPENDEMTSNAALRDQVWSRLTAESSKLTLATVPKEDPQVYDMICQADTIGVFQIESRAQMSMLPRLQPRKFYDLVIEVAIVRPGPIQGDMVHPYLLRREGKEPVEFPSPSPENGSPEELKAVLGKTFGVPLFQEQAMRLAIEAAKFSDNDADGLRRSMATFRANGKLWEYREMFIEGMAGRGYQRDFAERCFKQIEGFGSYGFPESHAISFALLVYASAWVKWHHPDAFLASLINSQPMGFYQPAQLVRDAREHGVEVRAPDVGFSDWDCTLEPAADGGRLRAVRLGLRQVKGFKQDDAEALASARLAGARTIEDFSRRGRLSRRALELLAEADAFRSLGYERRDALWTVKGLAPEWGAEKDAPLLLRQSLKEAQVELPFMSQPQNVAEDYRTTSLSLKDHPVRFFREDLARQRITPCSALKTVRDRRRLAVGGLVLVRQRPGTARGVVFLTIEDETGIANIIVWRDAFEANRRTVMTSSFLVVHGQVQKEGEVIHVVAERFTDLSGRLSELRDDEAPIAAHSKVQGGLIRSRDFH